MSDRDLRAAVDAAQQVSVSIMGSDGHVRVGFLTEAGAGFVVQRVLEALDAHTASDNCLHERWFYPSRGGRRRCKECQVEWPAEADGVKWILDSHPDPDWTGPVIEYPGRTPCPSCGGRSVAFDWRHDLTGYGVYAPIGCGDCGDQRAIRRTNWGGQR